MIHPKIENGVATFPSAHLDEAWKIGQILKIGKIIDHKGQVVTSLVLEPQGIAHLVSEECVCLPSNVCGLAHVLTRMCNEGLLTLNIGVVDPGWDNHLSTPALNFSSEKRLLQVGDPFIRITYHRITEADGAERDQKFRNCTSEDYERGIRSRAVGGFGKSFLNIKQLVGKASKKENARFKETMLKYLPIGAFSLAFFALMVTVGVAVLARISNENRQGELLERLSERINTLESRQQAVSIPATAVPQHRAQPEKASKGK
jgi:hypothetical protein